MARIRLLTGTLILLGVIHLADHLFNQPEREIHAEVFVSAGLGWLALLATFFLASKEDRWAPGAALITGLASASGFVLSHFVPHWGVLSDSFVGLGANWVTWTIAVLAVATSLLLAFEGLRGLGMTLSGGDQGE